MYELTVNPEDDGKRIDNVATKNMVMLMPQSEISRAIIQKMIEEGGVLLNNSVVKPGHKVKALDRITIDMERLEKEGLLGRDRKMPKAEKIALNIIYEDDDILVVNKPAGMVVHPACGNFSGTLVNALLHHAKSLSGVGGTVRPGIVHRLDKDTSGLLVIAKNDLAHRALAHQFKHHDVTRCYWTVVKGIVQHDEMRSDNPLGQI